MVPRESICSAFFAKAAPDYGIFVELRITRVLLGLLAGGALALGGGLFQAMLRDSLATPYTLGVSAGAALGAVLVLALDLERILGFPALWLGSMVGAGAVLAMVAGASWKGGHISGVRLLLTGISLNSICSAFILLIYGVVRERRSFSITQWLLGSVDSVSYTALFVFAIAVGAILRRPAASGSCLEPDRDRRNVGGLARRGFAARDAHGLRVRLRAHCRSDCTHRADRVCGLIVPHLVRSRISPDNRLLLPCSFLLGGVMLAACDAIGRVVLAPAELPAGAVMAVIGGPYLVWVVRRRF